MKQKLTVTSVADNSVLSGE